MFLLFNSKFSLFEFMFSINKLTENPICHTIYLNFNFINKHLNKLIYLLIIKQTFNQLERIFVLNQKLVYKTETKSQFFNKRYHS